MSFRNCSLYAQLDKRYAPLLCELITIENNFVQDQLKEIEQLFKKHHAGLCFVAFKILGDNQEAKDIVQDVFMSVWSRREKLDFSDTLKGYLFKAVSNASLNQLEKQSKLVRLDNDLHIDSLLEEEIDINSEEIGIQIKKALNKLPPKCKTIFILSKYQNLKYKEISEQLDISIKTVENQMSIALKN